MNDCIALVLCGFRVLKKSGKTAIRAMIMRTTPLTSASRCFLKRHHTSFQLGATSNASSSRNTLSFFAMAAGPVVVRELPGSFLKEGFMNASYGHALRFRPAFQPCSNHLYRQTVMTIYLPDRGVSSLGNVLDVLETLSCKDTIYPSAPRSRTAVFSPSFADLVHPLFQRIPDRRSGCAVHAGHS